MARFLSLCIIACSLTACSPVTIERKPSSTKMSSALNKDTYTSFDTDKLGYLHWANSENPDTVIIAVHGINGAAQDYSGLGSYIKENLPSSALYAAETRGQGHDPNKSRRGDIYRREEWYKDLNTFTTLIKQKHPNAKIIWCGESMGSLIVTHAYSAYPANRKPPCDAIILLAPVVNLSHKLPAWKYHTANFISAILPRYRVPLTALSGEESVKVTQGADSHDEQSATNSYHIPKFTLRLLSTLGKHICSMHDKATHFSHPTLIINGGKDYFTPPQYVETFYQKIPSSTDKQHRYFPDAYHLLMYDDQRQEIFADIVKWIKTKK